MQKELAKLLNLVFSLVLTTKLLHLITFILVLFTHIAK